MLAMAAQTQVRMSVIIYIISSVFHSKIPHGNNGCQSSGGVLPVTGKLNFEFRLSPSGIMSVACSYSGQSPKQLPESFVQSHIRDLQGSHKLHLQPSAETLTSS